MNRQYLKRSAASFVLVVALATAGCAKTADVTKADGSPPTAKPATPGGPYDATRNPQADIDAAIAASATDGKLVILDFGANWCPDCLVLDRLYRDSAVAPTLDASFRVVPIDVGRFDRNMDVSDKYGSVANGGIPALVVLRPDGSVKLDTRKGEFANARTMDTAELLDHLRQFQA